MKYLVLGLLCIAMLGACNDDCVENRMEFTWSNNQAITPITNTIMIGDSTLDVLEYQIIEGQNILFEFKELFNACDDDILDGVGSREFAMVIPADSTSSFSYTDLDIIETLAFVDIFEAPGSLPHQSVEEGRISGRKLDDNNWSVSIDIISKLQAFGEAEGQELVVIQIDTTFSLK